MQTHSSTLCDLPDQVISTAIINYFDFEFIFCVVRLLSSRWNRLVLQHPQMKKITYNIQKLKEQDSFILCCENGVFNNVREMSLLVYQLSILKRIKCDDGFWNLRKLRFAMNGRGSVIGDEGCEHIAHNFELLMDLIKLPELR